MAEMSGRWLPDGTELPVDRWDECKRRNRAERFDKRFKYCWKSYLWLMNALGLKTSFGLDDMLRQIEVRGSAMFYYPPQIIPKPEGGERIIISPKPELKLVQQRVHLLLKRTFERPPHVFGFRGGSRIDLVWLHKDLPAMLKFDVRDAFFKVGYMRVRRAIRGSKAMPQWNLKATPGFSGSVAHWIARLCTYTPVPAMAGKYLPSGAYSFLPQGASTSPICFDLACAKLDKRLARIAERVGGVMSRYADNYYFSMPTPEISPELQAMIVCSTRRGYGFPIHKLRVVGNGKLRRVLGYSLENGQVRNARGFQRRLKGALYVLQTKLDRGLDWQDAYCRVMGFMAQVEELPDKLQQVYEYCESKIANL